MLSRPNDHANFSRKRLEQTQTISSKHMQFDQTERGNRGFSLPKNSLPCDINDNGSVAYRALDFNPWKQMQRPGVRAWSNTIRSLPQQ